MHVPLRANISGKEQRQLNTRMVGSELLTHARARAGKHARAADLSPFRLLAATPRAPGDFGVLGCSGVCYYCNWPALRVRLICLILASGDSPTFYTLCRDFQRPAVTSLYAACPCGAVTFSALP